jgi:hypothetical protein
MVWFLVTGEHQERQILVAGQPDLSGGDDANVVGVEQQHRQPLRGRLRLHPGGESFLPTGILGLGRDQDLGKIQLIHQIQQEIHLVVI